MPRRLLIAFTAVTVLATACGGDDGRSLTVYSGRKEEIVGPLLSRFEDATGIDLEVRYADGPSLAATLREEGGNSPADVFFSVDPASLGAVAAAGMFTPLPEATLAKVPARFSDRQGRWVGTSGRSRVVVYDPADVSAADLPADVSGLAGPEWSGRLGIAPTNGSFLAFVAAMILLDGEDAAREWLEAVAANDPLAYPKNSVIVAAVDDGEVDAGLVNHYYLLRRQAEEPDSTAANHFLSGGPGALVMPAGAGVLAGSDNTDLAIEFVEFLLSEEAQRTFADQVFEYPLAAGIQPHPGLPSLTELASPDLDLSDLAGVLDLATDLVAEAGLL
jgi:iron(III) transport system substrate-binding protein